ncbi:MAG: hypothetical protein K0R08_1885 [Solimicrobium sp.]|jgi:hypothetical protein|nr:hypothetical protein [Solimicrobium sp.]
MRTYKLFQWVLYSLLCIALFACGGGGGSGTVTPPVIPPVIPTVTIITPTDGAVEVTLTPSVQLKFSIAVQNVNNVNVSLREDSVNGQVVDIGAVTQGADNIYTLTPLDPLKPASVYYVVVGSEIKNSAGDAHLVQTAFSFKTSTTTWIKYGISGGETFGSGIAIDSAGNSYISGSAGAALPGQTQKGLTDYFIAKYNSTGEPIWIRQVGVTGGFTSATDIAADSAGNMYVTGFTNTALPDQKQIGTQEYFIAKYDSDGNLIWRKQIGDDAALNAATRGNTEAYGIAVDNAGNSYVTGVTNTGLFGQKQNGSYDYFIVKYDSTGNFIWSKQAGASGGDIFGSGIAVDSAGNIHVTGYITLNTVVGQTNPDYYFVAKYDSNGVLAWSRQADANGGHSVPNGISVDTAGNSYVAGSTDASLFGAAQNGLKDLFIAKYDSNGALKWLTQAGASGGNTSAGGIDVDTAGTIYVTGSTDVALFGSRRELSSDYFIAKYDSTTGVLSWSKQVSSFNTKASGRGIRVDTSGNNYYVTGARTGEIPGQPWTGKFHYFVLRN